MMNFARPKRDPESVFPRRLPLRYSDMCFDLCALRITLEWRGFVDGAFKYFDTLMHNLLISTLHIYWFDIDLFYVIIEVTQRFMHAPLNYHVPKNKGFDWFIENYINLSSSMG